MTGPGENYAIGAAAALLAIVAILMLAGGAAGQGDKQKNAYVDAVRQHFIKPNLLIINSSADVAAGKPIVDFHPDVYKPENAALLAYATKSHLMGDIRSNNAALWVVENGKVVDIDAYAHIAPKPFADARRWAGDILFRSDVAHGGDELVLKAQTKGAPTVRFVGDASSLTTGDPSIAEIALGKPGRASFSGGEAHFYCGGEKGAGWITIRRIGDRLALWLDDSECDVEVEGRGHVSRFSPLAMNRRIRFTDKTNGRQFEYIAKAAAPVVRGPSLASASGQRLRDVSVVNWIGGFESDLTRVFGDRLRDIDVRTSLDAEMQPAVQTMLDAYVSDVGLKGSRPEIAAVTVMDALTGEVLAMGTWPHGPQPALVDRSDRLTRAASTNQNFERLPIGSTAKPLLSAAILAAQPNLAGLEVPQHSGPIDEVLGMKLPSTLNTHESSSAAKVGFDEYIKSSDNYYAAALLLLASADGNVKQTLPASGANRYWLGGVEQKDRVKSVFERPDGRQMAPRNWRMPEWADKVEALYDVGVTRPGDTRYPVKQPRCGDGVKRFGDGFHDASVWRGVSTLGIDLKVDSKSEDWCQFKRSTPERESLGLQGAADFRRELLPVMLGNGEGRWTTVKLAEAYARLVTGKRVRATFMAAPQTYPVRAETFGSLGPVFKAVRSGPPSLDRVTHALTLVTSGTASGTHVPAALRVTEAMLATRGLILGAFSKTGTPTIPDVRLTRRDQAINALIEKGILTFDEEARQIAVIGADGPSVVRPRQKREVAKALSGMPATSRLLAKEGVGPDAMADGLLAINGRLEKGEMPFFIDPKSKALVGLAGRQIVFDDEDPVRSRGKVFALVVGAYRPSSALVLENGRAANGAALPERAYSIAVNFQFRDLRSDNAAADFAGQITENLLAPRLAGSQR